MSKVTRIRHELPVSMDIVHAVAEFDAALVKAIDAAKEAGLPQGLLVGLLQGHAHAETDKMVAR
ncbi:hypothetical protein ACSESZ_00885 [Pseudomonas aeruginosa]|uniref:hypothetical protein n=1 Tax=Pseudomonas aeruginosa TaxID=287 RepID=UPI001F2C9284|nr:hypothetical protein [Pseudomonas aeruginosa]UIN43653.1 hypothetical protein LXN03_12205 [Pseudomonas aeruginosa]HBO2301170.1 hypothetical protein [Pseudomonas aeruginosa]HBO4858913.1 hypothetical protein [Pseudomonas aeruginosa]HCI4017206.1 hypothetical protein [Pseudomonas aeruginosa]HCT6277151.1 hypothetical protein [Pseudomonas aeruginosa]